MEEHSLVELKRPEASGSRQVFKGFGMKRSWTTRRSVGSLVSPKLVPTHCCAGFFCCEDKQQPQHATQGTSTLLSGLTLSSSGPAGVYYISSCLADEHCWQLLGRISVATGACPRLVTRYLVESCS